MEFNGIFLEKGFEYCRVDNFRNYQGGKAFFLSHFHTDHMIGLSDTSFHNFFRNEDDTHFYCSEITKKFIEVDKNILIPSDRIYVLENEEVYICYDDVCVKVTPIPAGHCPGSLMFLFESYSGRILFTGDFRLKMDDVKKIKALHNEDGRVVKIDNIYLDTTFVSLERVSFPDRETSLKTIQYIIESMKLMSDFNYIAFQPPANIGTEYLMIELHKLYNKYIHVSDYSYEKFHKWIPQLEKIVTTDVASTDIHFCTIYSRRCDPCPINVPGAKVLKIKPCALTFYQKSSQINECYEQDNLYFKVAYSSHSSLNELHDFVTYLKPNKIHPIVISEGFTKELIIDMILNWGGKKS